MLYELTFGEEQQQLIKLKVARGEKKKKEEKDAMLGSAVPQVVPLCLHFEALALPLLPSCSLGSAGFNSVPSDPLAGLSTRCAAFTP